MRPIPGQPGLYYADMRGRPYTLPPVLGLQGLGVPVATLSAKFTALQLQYARTQTSFQPLLAAYGPLDPELLRRIVRAIQLHQSSSVILTGSAFTGLVRLGLASAIGNLTMAGSILSGFPVGHEDLIAQLLTSAQNVLDALDDIATAMQLAQGIAATGARAVGLGAFALDDAALAIVATVGIVVAGVLLYTLVTRVQAASEARDAANSACARDTATGHPCTGAQWEQYRAAAEAAAHRQSLVPNFADILNQIGNVVLYGGLAIVAAAIGYGIWTTLPAAHAARGALRSRAERLGSGDGLSPSAREYLRERPARAALRDHVYTLPDDDSAEAHARWDAKRARLKAAAEAEEEATWVKPKKKGLRGLSGTPAQHRDRAEKLLAKARRENKSGHYGDALVTASAANAEAQWVDERLKGETYHEIVHARAALRLE